MNQEMKSKMVQTIRQYNQKGWSPATSTNYSFREEDGTIWVTRSGIDKSSITADDFIAVDISGNPEEAYRSIKPSAETMIHCDLYRCVRDTKVILHSHGIYPILLAEKAQKGIVLEGWEVQKGFSGVETHVSRLVIPVVENSQDMTHFSKFIEHNKSIFDCHCFVIRGHGTYAWGKNLHDAKRHLETLDYLCELNWKLLTK
jgi:methylthioribulose-1-phosphate dehydratase